MSKTQNEFKLKIYHSFILSCLLTILVIINSNHAKQLRAQNKLNQEKRQILNNIISKRYLQEEEEEENSDSDIKEVCKRGSEELNEYYKTKNLNSIELDEGKIKCEDKDEDYMKALINILKSYGGGVGMRNLQETEEDSSGKENTELKDNLITYGKHVIPILIFIIVAILCIPGWVICCFCCCCNCCCCCCCKKPGCKLPCFIISYAMYALVVVVCIYGFSQSNHIFIGLANTECSILQFFDEIINGEIKDELPKWAGIKGINQILNQLKIEVDNIGDATIEKFDNDRNKITAKKTPFKSQLDEFSHNLDGNSNSNLNIYIKNYPEDGVNSYAEGKYILDIIKKFGTFDQETELALEDSIVERWVNEYKEISEIADTKMDEAKSGFNDILDGQKPTIINALNQGIDAIDGIDSSFDGVKGEMTELLVDYSETIDEYGKLIVKAVFGVLALIDIGIAVLIFLLCFCSGKACVNCCCCRCICKMFTHILWNILAFLMIIVFLVGSLFALIGKIGADGMSLFSYLVSEDNLGKDKETILLADSKKYLNTCINGDGKIEDQFGFEQENLDSLNEIRNAQENIISSINQFNSLKDNPPTYNYIIDEIGKRKDLNTNSFNLFRISGGDENTPDYLNLGELLGDINNYAKNEKNKHEKWEITCNTNYGCSGDGIPSGELCFKPKNCLPKDRNWILTETDVNPIVKEKALIISHMKDIAVNAESDGNYFITKLGEVKDLYTAFLGEYVTTLGNFNTEINKITEKLNSYTGTGGGLFSFINCKFFGTNMKIILKYLKESLGSDLYTVGVCLILIGCSLVLAISSTILLIIIINIDIAKKKEQITKEIPEYPINSEGRVIRYRN